MDDELVIRQWLRRQDRCCPNCLNTSTLYGILMTQSMDTYKIERVCSNCGHSDEIVVSKRDAAFELVDINKVIGNTCRICASISFSTKYQRPELNFELLNEWSTNSDLHLDPQDEEIVLADEMYLDLILETLDRILIAEAKRNLLLNALCVIVYDNSIDVSESNDELKSRVIFELNRRLDKLRLADNWIMDYIKQVVYPQLAFSKPNAV